MLGLKCVLHFPPANDDRIVSKCSQRCIHTFSIVIWYFLNSGETLIHHFRITSLRSIFFFKIKGPFKKPSLCSLGIRTWETSILWLQRETIGFSWGSPHTEFFCLIQSHLIISRWGRVCTPVHWWRSEDTLQELVLSFHQPSVSWGLNSGRHAWRWAPSLTEPFCQSLICFSTSPSLWRSFVGDHLTSHLTLYIMKQI